MKIKTIIISLVGYVILLTTFFLRISGIWALLLVLFFSNISIAIFIWREKEKKGNFLRFFLLPIISFILYAPLYMLTFRLIWYFMGTTAFDKVLVLFHWTTFVVPIISGILINILFSGIFYFGRYIYIHLNEKKN